MATATLKVIRKSRIKVKALPKAWVRAAGILKGRGIDPVSYQKKIRSEWDQR